MNTFNQIDERNKRLHSRLSEVIKLREHAWRIVAKQYPSGYTSSDVEKVPQWQQSVKIAEEIFAMEEVHGVLIRTKSNFEKGKVND